VRASLVASALCALLCARSLHAQAEGVAEAFADGRYDLALEAAEGLSDPVLAAEWRFQVLHAAGDLPGALAAARAGLALYPQHPGLSQNAAIVALTLGEGRLALEYCDAWQGALEASTDAAERAGGLERLARYRASAEQLIALDAQAREATSRARLVAIVLLALTVLALLGLSGSTRAATPSA
jgi:hypothetical protein